MEFMIFMDRSYVFKYPVLNAEELFELGSIQSKFLAKKLWSPWSGDNVVSKETMDFCPYSLERIKFVLQYTQFKKKIKNFIYSSGMAT